MKALGAGAALLWPVLYFPTKRSLSVENRALKVRCEELAQARHDGSA